MGLREPTALSGVSPLLPASYLSGISHFPDPGGFSAKALQLFRLDPFVHSQYSHRSILDYPGLQKLNDIFFYSAFSSLLFPIRTPLVGHVSLALDVAF